MTYRLAQGVYKRCTLDVCIAPLSRQPLKNCAEHISVHKGFVALINDDR